MYRRSIVIVHEPTDLTLRGRMGIVERMMCNDITVRFPADDGDPERIEIVAREDLRDINCFLGSKDVVAIAERKNRHLKPEMTE